MLKIFTIQFEQNETLPTYFERVEKIINAWASENGKAIANVEYSYNCVRRGNEHFDGYVITVTTR